MSEQRSFYVGDVLHLRSRVSKPGTRSPVDPEVVEMTRLARDGVQLNDTSVAFTRVAEGDYLLSLPTAALTPGTYTVVVRHSSEPDQVAISRDTFVLRAP